MFNSIKGIITGKGSDVLFLLTGGIEWEIALPSSDLSQLPPEGDECRIYTWLYHREDSMRFFGFITEKRRNTFLELIKVEGIGPKNALRIMGGIGQDDLEQALENGDLARLEGVPGLGKKTAQKMLLALKGKLISSDAIARENSPYSELIDSLSQMGYDKRSVTQAVLIAEKDLPLGLSQAEKEKLLFKNAIIQLAGR